MKSKLWVFRDVNLSQRASLAQALSISPATASLFLARGVTTPDEATIMDVAAVAARSVFDSRHGAGGRNGCIAP